MKKSQIMALTLMAIVFLVFAACGLKPSANPVPTPPAMAPKPAPGASIPELSAKAAWQLELEKVEEAARREGKVAIYSTSGAPLRVVYDAFSKRYGIIAEFISGKGGEMAEKLFRERRAGLYLADIYQAGATTPITHLKPGGVLDRLDKAFIMPELTDPEVIRKTWWRSELPWVDNAHTTLAFLMAPHAWAVVNTDLVKPDEMHSWYDLLDPKWKGKIVMFDPTIAGTASKLFGATLDLVGEDFWRKFVKQEPVITKDHRLNIEWVARGKMAIVVTPTNEIVTMFVQVGSPIAYRTPKEGIDATSGSGNLSLMKNAPHPNAAKLLINWLLSKEGQILWSKTHGIQSAREDVGTEWVDPAKIRSPDIKIVVNAEREELMLKDLERYKLAEEIFAPVMKK